MNRDGILNMQAGQSMNELIAETFGIPVLNYSTDVSDSLVVLSEISDGYSYKMTNANYYRNYPGMSYGCTLEPHDITVPIQVYFALGETQALANCRAALLTTLED